MIRLPRGNAPLRVHTGLQITDDAVVMAERIGIGGDVKARVTRMAKRAAPVTHPAGNRRFDDFILEIQDGVVVAVGRF